MVRFFILKEVRHEKFLTTYIDNLKCDFTCKSYKSL